MDSNSFKTHKALFFINRHLSLWVNICSKMHGSNQNFIELLTTPKCSSLLVCFNVADSFPRPLQLCFPIIAMSTFSKLLTLITFYININIFLSTHLSSAVITSWRMHTSNSIQCIWQQYTKLVYSVLACLFEWSCQLVVWAINMSNCWIVKSWTARNRSRRLVLMIFWSQFPFPPPLLCLLFNSVFGWNLWPWLQFDVWGLLQRRLM